MKAGWEVKPLWEVCTKITDGTHHSPKTTSAVRKSGQFPYVTSKNIRNGVLDRENVTYVDAEFHAGVYSRCPPDFGDVLLTKDGSNTGQVTLNTFDEPISLLSSVALIKPKPNQVLAKYIVYYLQSDEGFENLTGQMTGAAIKRIILKNIKTSLIPIPPLEEQKRIVVVLDAAFEGLTRAKENAETNLQNARELFESFANGVVEDALSKYPSLTLPQISENLDRQRVPITKAKRTKGSVPYYGASGVVDHVSDHLFDEELLLVSEDGANLLARTYPIAFSISGKTWVNNHAHVLRFAEPAQQEFVSLYLNSISLEPYVSGMAQPKINQKALNTIPIPNLPIAQCKKVVLKSVELRRAVEDLQAIYNTKLQDIADLRQSLLQKAFAGELT